VRPGSLAEAAGIAPGDAVLELGGRILRDVVDYQFYQAEPEVTVRVRKAGGGEDLLVFEKAIDEDLGIEFERPTWDDVSLCNNNCFFCFLKGLPRGMRRTLYVKDDDYRLSFLHGNFVTLTNLDEADWARLAEQRLSPLHVSVHATEPGLRRRMLGNESAPDIVAQLRRLGELGLTAHTQIVLCPGVNDGAHLDRTIADLGALYPAVQTISVVPVGASPRLEDWSLTRDGVALVRPSPEYAAALLRQLRPFQRDFRRRLGCTVVHCSDEYYVTAGERVPAAAHYDGYPQYENGIGMVRSLLDDWRAARRRMRLRGAPSFAGRRVVVACGTLAAPVLAGIAGEMDAITGSRTEVLGVRNMVFGERVNVSGLLCGGDYLRELRHRPADAVILPRASLDYFGRQFLDSLTVEEFERELGAPVSFASQWSDVLGILEKGSQRPVRNSATNGAAWSEPPATVGAR
jgi:putative radical SAM enzyme (TIGR03279 family)